jgi:hypothetical protein
MFYSRIDIWLVWLYILTKAGLVTGLTYYFVVDCNNPSFTGATVASTGAVKTCASLIYNPPIISPETLVLQPLSDAYKVFRRSCCGQQATAECPGCYGQSTKCVLRFYIESDRTNPSYETFCTACLQQHCEMTCPNGKYAVGYMIPNPTSQLVETFTTCKDCKAGTFLTCVEDASCTW